MSLPWREGFTVWREGDSHGPEVACGPREGRRSS